MTPDIFVLPCHHCSPVTSTGEISFSQEAPLFPSFKSDLPWLPARKDGRVEG